MAHRMIKNPGFEDNKPLSLYPMQLPGTRRFSNNKEQPESSDFRGPVDDRRLEPRTFAIARRRQSFIRHTGSLFKLRQRDLRLRCRIRLLLWLSTSSPAISHTAPEPL